MESVTRKPSFKSSCLVTDSKANFLFAAAPNYSGRDLYLDLKARGILVRHFETPRLKDYNRITIGSQAQMEALLAAVKELLSGGGTQ